MVATIAPIAQKQLVLTVPLPALVTLELLHLQGAKVMTPFIVKINGILPHHILK